MSSIPHSIQSVARRAANNLPPALRDMLYGSAKSRLFAQVDTVLMVFDDKLYDLANDSWRKLTRTEGGSEAEVIASVAKELLGELSDKPSILLLLPSPAFISTQVSMPGVARENLRSALSLQAGVLLPAFEGNLVFTVNPARDSESMMDTVLWISEKYLDDLFKAFASAGLFLTGVMPRALAATSGSAANTETLIQDEDSTHITRVAYRNGVLSQFLMVNRQDLQEEEFKRQWQEQSFLLDDTLSTKNFCSAEDYLALPYQISTDREYCFLPSGAQEARKLADKGRRNIAMVAAAIVVLLLGASPFLWQSFQMTRLDNSLQALREESQVPREDQARVREFETSWGVLNEFPRQNISQTLLELQSVIGPSVLTSIEIDEGSVEIEGESEDPQSLLQKLEQNALFTGVDFSRATNNNRYYIELRLSTVDYDSYRQRYFPDERR